MTRSGHRACIAAFHLENLSFPVATYELREVLATIRKSSLALMHSEEIAAGPTNQPNDSGNHQGNHLDDRLASI